jgi:hypothetical protein
VGELSLPSILTPPLTPYTDFSQTKRLMTTAPMTAAELNAAIAAGKFKVTRLPAKAPRKADLVMTQTKGNRCRTNRSSGTNFVTQVR